MFLAFYSHLLAAARALIGTAAISLRLKRLGSPSIFWKL